MTNFARKSGPAQQVPHPAPSPTITIQEIKQEAAKLLQTPAPVAIPPANEQQATDKGLFLVHTAEEWLAQAQTRPTPQMLFSEFWYEGELCILFADTNLGKSILAVQIGNSISRGEPIPGFKLQAPAQPILYFDFELSEKQFEARYSVDYADHYRFNSHFYRAEMNPDAEVPNMYKGFEDFLNRSLEETIIQTGARVLIIDNLTYLKNETEKAHDALPLMKHLKALKQRYGLSILALAHTPKRDLCKPITRNDLQGSKMLMNFCDSAFAIGESHTDKNVRYLKQIKQRYTESMYDANNVIVCLTTKPENFLQFSILHHGTEFEHLKRQTQEDADELLEKIKEILLQDPALTAYAIAKKLCTDESRFNSFRVRVTRMIDSMNKA